MGGNPHMHWENMQTPHRKLPLVDPGIQPGPSCCARHYTTEVPSFKYIFLLSRKDILRLSQSYVRVVLAVSFESLLCWKVKLCDWYKPFAFYSRVVSVWSVYYKGPDWWCISEMVVFPIGHVAGIWRLVLLVLFDKGPSSQVTEFG